MMGVSAEMSTWSPPPIPCLPGGHLLSHSMGGPTAPRVNLHPQCDGGLLGIRDWIQSSARPPSLAVGVGDHGPGIASGALISNVRRGRE